MADPEPAAHFEHHNKKEDQLPHYLGHRARLKERFMDGGGQALADYELLELLLARTIPRRDVKPLAKALLCEFGSFPAVLLAPPTRLRQINGVGDAVIVDLKLIQASSLRFLQKQAIKGPVLETWSALMDYCTAAMAFCEREQFRILFLDRKNVLIADEVQQEGTIDHTPVYVREVLRRSIELSASAIILLHNHPSGDPTPSKADIDMTQKIIAAAQNIPLIVLDHIIIGRYGTQSLKAQGLM